MSFPLTTASVKVMRSFDYCHFEVCLGIATQPGDDNLDSPAVDELRKTAARLADKAVTQYQQAKAHEAKRANTKYALASEVERIMAKSEGDRSPNELAKVKALADEAYWSRREAQYDYEDDYQDGDFP